MSAQRGDTAPGRGRSGGRSAEVAPPRIGVYVCHCGGNISDVVDVEKVAEAAGELPGRRVARTNIVHVLRPRPER